jgi:magnesium-transporting ATPase (P-type)
MSRFHAPQDSFITGPAFWRPPVPDAPHGIGTGGTGGAGAAAAYNAHVLRHLTPSAQAVAAANPAERSELERRITLRESSVASGLRGRSLAEVLRALRTDPSTGLSSAEAAARLAAHGPNVLDAEPRVPLWKLFALQFTNFLILLLLVACVASFALRQLAEGIVVLVIVVINASIATYTERSSGNALERLSSMAQVDALVVRDGHTLRVPTASVVPGDVVLLQLGDVVPADCRLIDSVDLRTDEMILTGESADVAKSADAAPPRSARAAGPQLVESKYTPVPILLPGAPAHQLEGRGPRGALGRARLPGIPEVGEAAGTGLPLPRTTEQPANGMTGRAGGSAAAAVPVHAAAATESDRAAAPSAAAEPPGTVAPLIDDDSGHEGGPEGGSRDAGEDEEELPSPPEPVGGRGVFAMATPPPPHAPKQREEQLTARAEVFASTTITSGEGRGVVIKTGMSTMVGEIARTLKEAKAGRGTRSCAERVGLPATQETPLQKRMQQLGVMLAIAAFTACVAVFIIGVARNYRDPEFPDTPAWSQMILVAVSLAVSAIPEGLPLVITITEAYGTSVMATKQALVRRLPAVEVLGSAQVVCTDKTGTLTEGRMTALKMYVAGELVTITGRGTSPVGEFTSARGLLMDYDGGVEDGLLRAVLALGLLNCTAELRAVARDAAGKVQPRALTQAEINDFAQTALRLQFTVEGNSTDAPLVVAAAKAGLLAPVLESRYPSVGLTSRMRRRGPEVPFSSLRKLMVSVVSLEAPNGWQPSWPPAGEQRSQAGTVDAAAAAEGEPDGGAHDAASGLEAAPTGTQAEHVAVEMESSAPDAAASAAVLPDGPPVQQAEEAVHLPGAASAAAPEVAPVQSNPAGFTAPLIARGPPSAPQAPGTIGAPLPSPLAALKLPAGTRHVAIMKGAPQYVLQHCSGWLTRRGTTVAFTAGRNRNNDGGAAGASSSGRDWEPALASPSGVSSGAGDNSRGDGHIISPHHSRSGAAMAPSGARSSITDVVDDLSSQALRVLAVAFRPLTELPYDPGNPAVEVDDKLRALTAPSDASRAVGALGGGGLGGGAAGGWVFAGLVAAMDPEREGVGASIATARRAGVRVVMITGDYLKTAVAIAKNIALLRPGDDPAAAAVDCDVLRPYGGNEYLPEPDLDEITARVVVYARAKPQDKLQIVRSLQRAGLVTGMTGDGVNDAPALQEADIGVAMGLGGTEVAKGAADLILLDDNFNTIVDSIYMVGSARKIP